MSYTSVKPYRGDKPYIFISYSHRNTREALEIIGGLQSAGYRVWYDEGIDPGTEWDENIASHVENCGYFLALLSQEYLDSSNCKDELNYARDLEKSRLLVYLTDVKLSGGMRMRLGRIQAIHKYAYAQDQDFFEKLLNTQGLEVCLGEASEDIPAPAEEPAPAPAVTAPVPPTPAVPAPNLTKAPPLAPSHVPSAPVQNPSRVRLVCMVDTSGSMAGQRIRAVESVLQRLISDIDRLSGDLSGNGMQYSLDIMEFSTGARWSDIRNFHLEAAGLTYMGCALSMLRQYGQDLTEQDPTLLMIISDGTSTDDFVSPLRELRKMPWFNAAIKVAIAVDDDADVDLRELAAFTGAPAAVRRVETYQLSRLSDWLVPMLIRGMAFAVNNVNGRIPTRINGRNLMEWRDQQPTLIRDNYTWELTPDGTLRIMSAAPKGVGVILRDLPAEDPGKDAPWQSSEVAARVRSIKIGEGICVIGANNFVGFTALEDLTLPHSLTDIRSGAFRGCTALAKLPVMPRPPYTVEDESQLVSVPSGRLLLWNGTFEGAPFMNDFFCW